MPDFDKYQRAGAYHWQQADSHSKDSVYNPLLIARYKTLTSFIPKQTTTILDLGCGDGYLVYLSGSVSSRSIVGLDNNGWGVWLAKQKLSKKANRSFNRLSIASMFHLCFPDNAFDLALMADVIEHLEYPDLALVEARRVLTADGLLLLSTPNWQPDRTWDKRHVREFTPEALKELLQRYFAQVQLWACWPMWWVEQWQRRGRRQRLINWLCRLGYNPFTKITNQPTLNYGQLVAVCQK